MSELTRPDTSHADTVGLLRRRMIEHPVFTAIDDMERLRKFMEAHVFAVWDFMSLVKRLQRELTCVEVPWLPPKDQHAAQLMNEIVLGEETDVGPAGEPISHLELYLGAMREVGARTVKFEAFRSALHGGADLGAAFDQAGIEPFVRTFTGYTLRIAREAPTLEVMSSFFFGREDVIPHMFDHLLKSWSIDAAKAPMFVYYLKRHIELDGDKHGPAAAAILRSAAAGDPERQYRVVIAACESIDARIRFWDGLLASLAARKEAASAL